MHTFCLLFADDFRSESSVWWTHVNVVDTCEKHLKNFNRTCARSQQLLNCLIPVRQLNSFSSLVRWFHVCFSASNVTELYRIGLTYVSALWITHRFEFVKFSLVRVSHISPIVHVVCVLCTHSRRHDMNSNNRKLRKHLHVSIVSSVVYSFWQTQSAS